MLRGENLTFLYQRRHKRRALLLTTLIGLATLGVGITVGVLDSFLQYSGSYDHFLTRFSVVSVGGAIPDPSLVSQISAHPDVARVIPEKSLGIVVPVVRRGIDLFGVSEADLQVLLQACNLRLKAGRLLTPRTNQVVLSEELADALGLRVGDRIGRSVDEKAFGDIPTDLVLVGTLEDTPSAGRGSALRLGFVSYEYLESQELYASQPTSLIVVPQEGRKDAVDHFLETTIAPLGTSVSTYRRSAQVREPVTNSGAQHLDISQITENLYISSRVKEEHLGDVLQLDPDLILSMIFERRPIQALTEAGLQVLWLRTVDFVLVPIPLRTLKRGVEAALPVIQDGGRVLVFCQGGRHRSVALASAILIGLGYSADEAMQLVSSKREVADPHAWHVRRQIRRFEAYWLLSEDQVR